MSNDDKTDFSIDLGEFTLSEEISSATKVNELPQEVEFSMDISDAEKAEIEAPSEGLYDLSAGLEISSEPVHSLSISDEVSEEVSSETPTEASIEKTQHDDDMFSLSQFGSEASHEDHKDQPPIFTAEETKIKQVPPPRAAPTPVAPPPPPPASFFESSSMPSGDEADTLKKYAALKERELREKDSMIAVLRSQVTQVESKLQKSEIERRRVSHEFAELQTLVKTLEEQNEGHQYHTRKLEEQHQEEIRAIQLRLDNVQFQAAKAEKKLEEFRARVKQDIVKIRERERELMNRLELAKRDTEALLKAKDERLMSQRREIDKLQFEMESLKEKLLEDTQKAEDRAGRVARAMKSLRMVTGILSTIEEDVLPSAANAKGHGPTGNDGEAA